MKTKKAPLRTCIACSKKCAKEELVRFVRTPQGELELDLSSRAAGRGAYVCKNEECFDFAFKRNVFERRLKTRLDADKKLQLKAEFRASLGAQ